VQGGTGQHTWWSRRRRLAPDPARPPDARSLLRRPFAWSVVALGAVLAATMTFSYLYGFLEPTRRLHDLAIGIVNLDRGAAFGGERITAGAQVVAEATRPQPGPVQPIRWRVLRSRAALLRELRDAPPVPLARPRPGASGWTIHHSERSATPR
jgi:hypothetical protein